MDGAIAATVGPGSPLDRLPDDNLLHILVAGACDPEEYPLDGFGDLRKLCQLRTVCHRFDDLVMGAENIAWGLTNATIFTPGAHRFLQQCEKLKAIRLHVSRRIESAHSDSSSIPVSFWLAISGVTPNLEKFELSGGMLNQLKLSDVQVHEIFKTMAMCPQLASLKLQHCNVHFTLPLSPRNKLNSVINLHLSNVDLSDRSLSSILDACPRLESLTLPMVAGLMNPIVTSSSLKVLLIKQQRALMSNLKIVAPQLRYLSASGMTVLTVSASNLEELVLGHTCAIVTESTWNVTILEVGQGSRNSFQLMNIFAKCKDVRSLRVLPLFETDTVTRPQVALSKLLQHFQHLEHLELSSDLAKRIHLDTVVEDAAPLRVCLANLTTLKVCFEKLHDQSDLCLELCRIAPRLVNLSVDLTDLVGRRRADVVVMRLLELQRRYPQVNIVVNWPKILQ